MFMAAEPEGATRLDHDREEAGILRATERLPLHLRVEESGCLDFLVPRLAAEGTIEALHLSCHGTVRDGEPSLMLEDAKGFERQTRPADLVAALGERRPPLVFLSACRTAERTATPSLAMRLIRAGVANVVGWDGSVFDDSATAFAHSFYEGLGRHQSIPYAAARARSDLPGAWRQDRQHPAGMHWHLARLYLGPAGGGAVAAAGKPARPLPKNTGYREFLDKEGKVPVASARAFVGRRRQAQKVLRAFDDQRHAGVLIHGIGRQGKSSLAARLANRLARHRAAVVFEHYHAHQILQKVLDVLPADAQLELARRWRDEVVRTPSCLEQALSAALARFTPDAPLLLIVDDLEQILETPEAGRDVLVKERYRPTLAAVIRAFRKDPGPSHLLLTSRYRFTLIDDDGRDLAASLFDLPLPAMDPGERNRQLRAERTLRGGDDLPEAQAALFARAADAAFGNPGLQSLLTCAIIDEPALAETAIAEVEAYRETRKVPKEKDLGQFFQELTLGVYGDALTPPELAQLRAAFLFDLPAPHPVMVLAGEASLVEDPGAALDRLTGLGLMEVVHEGEQALLQANRLARPLFEPLSDADAQTLAKAVAEPLADAWRDKDGALPAHPRSVELARLASLAGDRPGLHGEAAARGASWLYRRQHMAKEALALIEPGLQVLKDAGLPLDPHDVRLAVDCAERLGETQAQDRWLDAEFDQDADRRALAMLQVKRADREMRKGEIGRAKKQLRDAVGIFQSDGDERSVAITQGKIADILVSRGELDEALRIRTEEELPVLTRLGDVREIAITRGKIADILDRRGELDEALRIRTEEELPVFTKLGDVRSIAVTYRKIADVLWSRGELDTALALLQEEALPRARNVNAAADIAVFQGRIADILARRGELDEALRIRTEEQLPVYTRLGDVREIAITQGQIADILVSRGELDEALRIRKQEQLPVLTRLGDVREIAIAQGRIADILVSRGELDEARKLQEINLDLSRQLQDPDAVAGAQWSLAQIDMEQKKFDEALPRVSDAYQLLDKLGRLDGLAAVGVAFGQFLIAGGKAVEGRQVLERSVLAFRKLGRDAEAAQVQALLEQIGGEEG